jgi:hypothetical protein
VKNGKSMQGSMGKIESRKRKSRKWARKMERYNTEKSRKISVRQKERSKVNMEK